MAFVNQTEDQNQLNQQPGMQAPQTSGSVGGSSMGTPQGATAVTNASKAPPVQDLKAYLQANAPQAVQMGQNIAGNLGQQAQTVTGNIDSASQALGQQIQSQNVTPNQDLINQAASNPSGFVQNDQNVQNFLKQRDANYTGPANFQATPYSQTLTNEVANAQANAPDINKPGGVQQLVRGQEKNPTQGMANLDTLLLQENPTAMAPIQGVIPQFANLDEHLGTAQGNINNQIQQTIANDQAAKQGVQDRFLTGSNAVVPQFNQGLQDQLSQAQQQATKYNTDLNSYGNYLNANQPFHADLTNSGLINRWLGSDPFTAAPPALTNAPTMANTATAHDYATESALEQLLGNGLGPEPINQSTAGQPGGFSLPGKIPQQQSILSILDSMATNGYNLYRPPDPNFATPPPQSHLMNIVGGSSGDNSEFAAFRNLLNQVSSLYPTSNYVQPDTLFGNNIGYKLTS